MNLFDIGVKLLSSLLKESPNNDTVYLEENDKKKCKRILLN